MPYFDYFNEDDQQQQQQLSPAMNQAFSTSTGGAGRPASVDGPPSEQPAPQAPGAAPSGVAGDSGSNFVNFERYVNTNQDTANKAAANVANTVEHNASDASGALGSLIGQFNGQVDQGAGHGPATGTAIVPGNENGGTSITTNRAVPQGMGAMELNGRGTPPASSPGSFNSSTQTQQDKTPGMFGSGGTPAPKGSPPATSVTDPNAPAPPPQSPPTRDDLVKGAEQKYTGPLSLTADPNFNAVTGQITNAASQVGALGSKEGLSGLLAKNFGSGAVGSGGNELDSLLLGRAGGERFGQIQKGYGDLENRVGRAMGDADTRVHQAQHDTEDAAGAYKGLLSQFDAGAADDKTRSAAKIAGQQTEAQRQLDSAKRTADYFAPRHENTIRDIGNTLDPTHWLGEAFGFRGINDRATDAAEKYARDNGMENDSRHVHGLPPPVMEAFSKMFPNLTDQEVKALEQMSQTQQVKWITDKANSMGMK